MDKLPHYPRRKSPRLKGYDYTRNGAYFVTVCVQNRLSLFGNVSGEMMVLNAAGEMVAEMWHNTHEKFTDVQLDHFVVMPNHFHAVVVLHSGGTGLPDVMQWFKTMTTNAYIRGVKADHWTPFAGKLWQRSYHDHIIRDEAGLNAIRAYILINPARWSQDAFFIT